MVTAAQFWCVCPVLGLDDIMALTLDSEGLADSAAHSEPLKHDKVEVSILGKNFLSAEESVALFNNL